MQEETLDRWNSRGRGLLILLFGGYIVWVLLKTAGGIIKSLG